MKVAALLCALLVVVVAVAFCSAAENEMNFIFSGMIPPAREHREKDKKPDCPPTTNEKLQKQFLLFKDFVMAAQAGTLDAAKLRALYTDDWTLVFHANASATMTFDITEGFPFILGLLDTLKGAEFTWGEYYGNMAGDKINFVVSYKVTIPNGSASTTMSVYANFTEDMLINHIEFTPLAMSMEMVV